VRFELSADQLDFRAAVADLLTKEVPPEVVRATAAGDHLPAAWDALAAMGVTGLLVAEDRGGLGLSWLDLVLLVEEAGRAALAEPLTETVAVAPPLLARSSDPRAVAWLEGIAAGTVRAAVVLPLVPYAAGASRADVFVVATPERVVALGADEVERVDQPSLDPTRDLATITATGPGVVLAEGADAAVATADAADAFTVGVSAQLLGLADRMLAMAGAYAKERVQFGVPIGSFQAVKHLLADGLLRLEVARPVVRRAAHSLATRSPERSRDASMAKVYAGLAGELAARVSLQVHGAIGYTAEYDLQLFMKRAWSLVAAGGDVAHHRERVARAVLD
jgi:alkylation response protein AidB-like acyl-CoA dehydrogenase